MTKKTQLEKIKNILKKSKRIDNFRCIDSRLTLRLGAHIHILRSNGWEIETVRTPNKNCVYVLKSFPQDN